MVMRSVFRFDLVERKLRWKRTGLFTRVGGVIPFIDIHGAAVQSHWSNDDGRTYRVTLRTTVGDMPITETYSSGEERPLRICTLINDTLARHVP